MISVYGFWQFRAIWVTTSIYYTYCIFIITVASLWAWWHLKTPASRLFTQPFIQGADQRKYQSSASLAFVRGIHRWPVNSPHQGPVTRKMFPFDDVIMCSFSPYCSGGYTLPKGTWVMPNVWAMHHDPSEWEQPDRFIPERHLDENGSLAPKPNR